MSLFAGVAVSCVTTQLMHLGCDWRCMSSYKVACRCGYNQHIHTYVVSEDIFVHITHHSKTLAHSSYKLAGIAIPVYFVVCAVRLIVKSRVVLVFPALDLHPRILLLRHTKLNKLPHACQAFALSIRSQHSLSFCAWVFASVGPF